MNTTSVFLDRAVAQFASLPGIGRKTAMRLVLHLLRRETKDIESFATTITELAHNVQYCHKCHNISDNEICPICASHSRDHATVCVVENVQDVLAIEATQQYSGVYHVLGGVISPMDGIGPQDLEIDSLLERIHQEDLKELIFALSPTMEGDTTAFYIYRRMGDITIQTTTLARGVAQNDQLQYTDELTLGRSLLERRPFNQT